jgi:hypothetical protein
MNLATPTEAESFQLFLSRELAQGGRDLSPEELLQRWRSDQQELQASVAAIREAVDNMNAGARGQSVEEVARELQQRFGWTEPV